MRGARVNLGAALLPNGQAIDRATAPGFLKLCLMENMLDLLKYYLPGAGCSKLTMSLVSISLNFKRKYYKYIDFFLLKKCENLLHCKRFSQFSNKT